MIPPVTPGIREINPDAEAEKLAEARKRQRTPADDASDDILIGITDGKPVATAALQVLPPWRAVLLARVADKAGIGLERGTLAQLVAEARAVTGTGVLGAWWERVA